MDKYINLDFIKSTWDKCEDIIISLNFKDKWQFTSNEDGDHTLRYCFVNLSIVICPDDRLIYYLCDDYDYCVDFANFNAELFVETITSRYPYIKEYLY